MNDPTVSPVLIRKLAEAKCVAVLTGAGVSAESGIPTFRDPGGLWQKFRPEELANINAFLRNPVLVQQWYRHRRELANQKEPNAGHHALRDLETMIGEFCLITQNVDNLHRRAGNENVLELHGNIARNYCMDCRRPATDADFDRREDEPMRCPDCDGLIRPDVVWFGETLPEETLEAAFEVAERADVFLTVGTSAVVYPAAGIPLAARSAGAYVAEINVEPSAICHGLDEVVIGPAGVVLPHVVQAVRKHLYSTSRG